MKKVIITLLAICCCYLKGFAQLSVSVSGLNNAANVCTRTLTANVSGGSGNYTYTWGVTNSCSPPNNTSQSINITCDNNSTAYVVVLDNVTSQIVFSSPVSVSKIVRGSFSVFIPNVFTPNGDGINDTWQVLDSSHSTGLMNAHSSYVEIRDPVHSALTVYNQNFTDTGTTGGLNGGYASYDGAGWPGGTVFNYYVSLQNCTNFTDYSGTITLIK